MRAVRIYLYADLYYEGMYALALQLCIRVELQMARRKDGERERETAKNQSEFRIYEDERSRPTPVGRLYMLRCRACAQLVLVVLVPLFLDSILYCSELLNVVEAASV